MLAAMVFESSESYGIKNEGSVMPVRQQEKKEVLKKKQRMAKTFGSCNAFQLHLVSALVAH